MPEPSGWPTTAVELARAQARLAAADPTPWQPATAALVAGGSACCFARRGDATTGWTTGWAGACRLAVPGDGDPGWVDTAVAVGAVGAPYRPGRLALREGPLREAAVRRLAGRPDVLLVSATGRDHPAGAGLALHLGAVLDLPTVGVTDRPLVATGTPPPDDRAGAHAPLRVDGEVVGWWVRTRASARPVVVHAAWRTTPEVALEVILASVADARLPEPLRHARRAAREARAVAAAPGGGYRRTGADAAVRPGSGVEGGTRPPPR